MPQATREEPAVVVGKTYDFLLWLLPKAEKFSRSYRFSVGERVVSHGLDLLLILVGAAYSPNKAPLLELANSKSTGCATCCALRRTCACFPLTATVSGWNDWMRSVGW